MYDYNIFREVKKIMEEHQYPFQRGLKYPYAPEGVPPTEGTVLTIKGKKHIAKDMPEKRKFFEQEVRDGKMSPEEFHHYALSGEFVEWHPHEEVKEEQGYDHFDLGPTPEEDPNFGAAEAQEEHERHVSHITDKLMKFLARNPSDTLAKHVKQDIGNASVHSNPHEPNSSVVRVAGKTFVVPHEGHQIKVVS